MAQIHHWDTQWRGPLDEQTLAAELRALGYRVPRCVYPPGTYFASRTHAIDKIKAVLNGMFRRIVDGEVLELRAGDWAEVARNVPYSAEVLGAGAVVSLDAERD